MCTNVYEYSLELNYTRITRVASQPPQCCCRGGMLTRGAEEVTCSWGCCLHADNDSSNELSRNSVAFNYPASMLLSLSLNDIPSTAAINDINTNLCCDIHAMGPSPYWKRTGITTSSLEHDTSGGTKLKACAWTQGWPYDMLEGQRLGWYNKTNFST